jgi:glycosyltransferase involved in cell wall biosynthesis
MVNEGPSISAIIPAYNAEPFLARAIESVLGQTCPPMELIVVDDGSTDGTGDVARRFGDRVRFFHQENAGVSAARNLGIEKARGEWIAFLDADDWWEPERLAWQRAILEHRPGLMWVGGRFVNSMAQERGTVDPFSSAARSLLREGGYFADFYEAVVAGAVFCTDVMLVKKRVLAEVGRFDTAFRTGEDRDLWCRIADRYPEVGYVDAPIAVYDRATEDSLTKGGAERCPLRWRFLVKHFPPGSRFVGRECAAKEQYFRTVVRRYIWDAFLWGHASYLKQFLAGYGRWLSLGERVVGHVAVALPPSVLSALGRWCNRLAAARLSRRSPGD